MTTGTLHALIKNEIAAQDGFITFDRFMELALYHPTWGYYMRGKPILGEKGDFTTASEISPLFAQCFAEQCREIMMQLPEASILELGAGSGRFAGDLLEALQQLNQFPVIYYIYEISPYLRQQQQHYIQTIHPALFSRVVWLDKLPDRFTGIIIANEVLDALPTHRFQIQQQQIAEQCVSVCDDTFVWHSTPPRSKALELKAQYLLDHYQLSEGYTSEINLRLTAFLQTLARTLKKGVILFSDYGYGESEYYHPERRHGTLTCFSQHHHHNNPLAAPGMQDITAHVNFTDVINDASDAGCTLLGYTTQVFFLLACGLLTLAETQEKKLSPKEQFNFHQAIKLLTMPTEMGERVKVMALGKEIELALKGFSLQDRSREL